MCYEELTYGLISIQASMLRDKYIRTTQLLRFIKRWQRRGRFESLVYPYLRDIRWAKTGKPYLSLQVIKINLIEKIIMESVVDKEVRIDMQRCFGQFDGAQVCEHCGDIMTEGYSWDGTVYCDMPCVLEGEGITRDEADTCLEDAEDPDGTCYWTDWGY